MVAEYTGELLYTRKEFLKREASYINDPVLPRGGFIYAIEVEGKKYWLVFRKQLFWLFLYYFLFLKILLGHKNLQIQVKIEIKVSFSQNLTTFHRIDGTEDCGQPSRLINNSVQKYVNLEPRAIKIDGVPRLFFVATCDIPPGRQLFYTYGDDRESMKDDFPWLFSDDHLTEGKHLII